MELLLPGGSFLRWGAVAAHVLASVILMALTVALLRIPAEGTDDGNIKGRLGGGGGGPTVDGCGDDHSDVFTGCPRECLGVGTCLENKTCACNEGYHGVDCSRLWCPKGCSGRGVCVEGTCACDYLWGGPDCTVDKLSEAMTDIAPLVAKSLSWDPGEFFFWFFCAPCLATFGRHPHPP